MPTLEEPRYLQYYSFVLKDGTIEAFTTSTRYLKTFTEKVATHRTSWDAEHIGTPKEIKSLQTKFTFYGA